MKILVLEASTTSAKAMLYDTGTGEKSIKVMEYGQMYEDVTLHHAEQVFSDVVKVGKQLASGQDISMISLSATWHSLFLCDKEMRPLTPVYLWSNVEASDICKQIRLDQKRVRKFYQRTGCMVNAIYPVFKLMMLQEQRGSLKDCYIMGQGTYMTYRLTGERVISECMASGTGLLNIHRKQFDEEILRKIGVDNSQLSELVAYDRTFPLNAEGAGLLGLREGIPVIPANADGGLNQLGVGALQKGVMTFSAGTSGAMRLTVDRVLLPEKPATWCYLSPKGWLSGAAVSGCCNCLEWFRKEIAGERYTFQELEEIEENERNLREAPYFFPFIYGERCPGWNDERVGGFEGIRPWHTIRNLYRSLQEGVLFNLYHCYQELEKLHGEPACVKLSGGILNSRRWSQMCADIFGREIEVDEVQHGSMMGAVVLAMEVMGVIEDASKYHPVNTGYLLPDRNRHQMYQERFGEYLKLYQKVAE